MEVVGKMSVFMRLWDESFVVDGKNTINTHYPLSLSSQTRISFTKKLNYVAYVCDIATAL